MALFQDRLGTSTFSFAGHTAKLRATVMNLMRFEKVTGTDNLLAYCMEKENSDRALGHIEVARLILMTAVKSSLEEQHW